MADKDDNNFSSSSPHRLPTLSASQALQNLTSTIKKPIETGLKRLDAILQGREHHSSSQNALPGGISRGEVTEIYGPPGVGKTAFAMQVSASALRSGGSVIWVDASYRLVGPRFEDILSGFLDSQHDISERGYPNYPERTLDSLHHLTTPTLPHFLALFTHPSVLFPPQNTSLLVVDSISTLFALAFPKMNEKVDNQQTPVKKSDAAQWAAGRRWAVMGDLILKLGKLAATRNIAVLLMSQTTTRIRSDTGAVLNPAILGTAWDSGISTRIVLYRDWIFQVTENSRNQGAYVPGVRFAGVMKAKGVSYEGVGKVITFKIEKRGLQEVEMDHAEIKSNSPPILPPTTSKRKREEISDSELEDGEAGSDQEFGWAGDDDPLNTEGLLG